MTRNLYRFTQRTVYHETTGKPYTVWFASCKLTSGPGTFFFAQGDSNKRALTNLKTQLRVAQHSIAIALKYPEKKT